MSVELQKKEKRKSPFKPQTVCLSDQVKCKLLALQPDQSKFAIIASNPFACSLILISRIAMFLALRRNMNLLNGCLSKVCGHHSL